MATSAALSVASGAATTRDGELRDRIMRLARGASIEAAVKNLAEIDGYGAFIERGAALYLPWLPGQPYAHLVAVAARLKQAGYRPVPHIAVRRLPDWESAEDFISRLAGESGVEDALVIGGDIDRPTGAFDSAAALLESGLLQRHGIHRIGIAGYPEGHPKIPQAELEIALKRKIDIAKASGLDLHLVSQFCFDAGAILRWIDWLASRRVSLPVRVGLAGPARLRTLINYGVRCGVGPSLRALRSHGVSLTRLAAQSGPEKVLLELAEDADSVALPLQLHLFSFGGVERTARWLGAAARGDFRLRDRTFDIH